MTEVPAPETLDKSESPDPVDTVRPAIVERRTRSAGQGFIWLIPIAALVVSIWIAVDAWSDRGPRIVVEFAEVHGLEAGDAVRCRGVEIGRVEAIEWSALGNDTEAARSIRVRVTIRAEAADLVRAGSGFWIARPEFDYGGVRGLETVVGPRYLALSPGAGEIDGGPFIGLEEAPVEGVNLADGLQIVIESPERRGMRRGGMVTYRGMPAGRILEVELASDAARVEARVVIDRRHATLIRKATRFFSTSGVSFEFGLEGLRADVDSLESLVSGGIAFATPPDAGDRAASGSRFTLAPRAEEAWLEWSPRIALGGLAVTAPSAVRASLRWTGGVFGTARSRSGWITLIDDEFVAMPAALLSPPADGMNVTLECEGISIPRDSIIDQEVEHADSIRLVPVSSLPDPIVMRLRDGTKVELGVPPQAAVPLLVWTGSPEAPLPIAIDAWSFEAEGVSIDASLALPDDAIGSPVTDGASGRLIGLVVPAERGMMVATVSSVPPVPPRNANTD